MEEQGKTVTILAKGESRIECPFDGETWGLNDVMELPEFANKKVDLLFTFDPRSEDYLKAMRKHAPIVSWQPYADIKYPIEEIAEKYSKKYRYFTNTVSYMMAYALFKGYKKIRMYGVDAPFGGIYYLEKPGIEYWAGKAEEAGVDIETTEGSHILRTKDGKLYGVGGDSAMRMYLVERLVLLNSLPRQGRFLEIHMVNMIRNLLALKDDEAREFGVALKQNINGSVDYQIGKDKEGKPGREFSKLIWMPEYSWRYLAKILQTQEEQGKLPALAESIYTKLLPYGQADNVPAKPAAGQIKVSYIMPTKNRAKWVKNTLGNIQRSRLLNEHAELIVVDGDSEDETRAVLQEYDKMIAQVIRGKDRSAMEAFNKGVLVARGEYVKNYPDDDVIFPEGMEIAVKYMDEHPEVDLLVCGGTKEGNGQRFQVTAPDTYGHKYEDVFKYGACGTGFFHRRASFARIGMVDRDHLIADQEFAVRAIKYGTVRFLPGNLYLHPIYPHSISVQNRPAIVEQHKTLVKQYCPELLEQKVLVGGAAQ